MNFYLIERLAYQLSIVARVCAARKANLRNWVEDKIHPIEAQRMEDLLRNAAISAARPLNRLTVKGKGWIRTRNGWILPMSHGYRVFASKNTHFDPTNPAPEIKVKGVTVSNRPFFYNAAPVMENGKVDKVRSCYVTSVVGSAYSLDKIRETAESLELHG